LSKDFVASGAVSEKEMASALGEVRQEEQRLAMASLILTLVHNHALTEPAHTDIPLFTLPDEGKEWGWAVKVARSIEGQGGYLSRSVPTLTEPWAFSPVVKWAAEQMSGNAPDSQDGSFFQRWIQLGALEDLKEKETDKWKSLSFQRTLNEVFPRFSREKLSPELVYPLFVRLAANHFVCRAGNINGTINNSFNDEFAVADQDVEAGAELMKKQAMGGRLSVRELALLKEYKKAEAGD